MAARAHVIPAAARTVLTGPACFDGPRVTITRQLDPAEWQAVKAVLERLGAVYVVNGSAFDFAPDQDAADVVGRALAAGTVVAEAAAVGYVPTPATLAAELIDRFARMEWQRGGLRVLEPSAGTGPLVRALLRDAEPPYDDADPAVPAPEWVSVTAVESDPRRAANLAAREHPCVTVRAETFERFAAGRTAEFDRVVMNPPFSTPGHADLWAEHVLLAWRLLAPGGRLTAIVPASAAVDRAGKHHRAVRALIADHGGVEVLDGDAFAESGTMVRAAVMWLDKVPADGGYCAPPAPADMPAWAWRTYPATAPAVSVPRVYVTPAASRSVPLQAVPGFGGDRVLCFRGMCFGCGIPAWSWVDGDDDPRGGWPYIAGWSLDPDEHDAPAHLPRMVLCGECGQTTETADRAEVAARAWWAALPADVPAVGAPVTVAGWSEMADVAGYAADGRVIVSTGDQVSRVPADMVTAAPAAGPAAGWGAVLEQLALPL